MKNSKILRLLPILFFMGVVFAAFNSSAAFEKKNLSSYMVQNYWWDSAADSSLDKLEYWWVGQNNIGSASYNLDRSVDYWWSNNSSAGKNFQCYWWLNGPGNNYCQA